MPTYRGPYSPDFDRDGVGSPVESKVNDAASYPATKSTLRNAAFKTTTDDGKSPISIADFVDPQPDYGHGFDSDRKGGGGGSSQRTGGNWREVNSDSGLAGYSGPMPKSNTHPKAGLIYGKKTS